MIRPNSITVGGRVYKIVVDSTLLLAENLIGQCDHQKYIIKLAPRFFSGQLDEALWHETLHAINTVFLNGKLVEEDVDALAHGLFQVLSGMGLNLEWEKGAVIDGNPL